MSIVTPLNSRSYYIIFGSGLTFIFLAIFMFLGLISETLYGFPIEFSFLLCGIFCILVGLYGIRKTHGKIIL